MDASTSQPIRRQLILLLLTLGLPFLVYLGVSGVIHAHRARDQAGREMLALARLTSARLDDHVGDITEVLAVLSEAVGVTPADEDRNNALLTRLAPRLPPHVNNVTVFALDGRIVGSLDPRMRARVVDISSRSFFKKAIAEPDVAVQAPFKSAFNGEPVAVFALRIERAGQVVGLVSLGTQLRHLQSLLAPDGTLPAGAVTTVVGQDGVVLARSIDPDKWIGRNVAGLSSGFADGLLRREGVRDGPGVDGIVRIGGFTTAGRVPWLVYVGMPGGEATAATRAQLHENLIAGALMLLVGLALSMRIAGRISLPLQRLREDARALEAGDLSHRSDVRGTGEIAVLSRTLNQMADALQQRAQLLEANEQQLKDLYDNAPCGYHSLDATGLFVRVNDIELQWLGFTREQVVGKKHIGEFLTAEGRHLFAQEFPRLQSEGRLEHLEFDLIGHSGERRHVIASVSVIRDAQGAFEMTRTALYDITELQRARRALSRLTDEQQAILDTGLIGILKLVDRHIVWCNRGAERLFGYAPGGLLGRSTRVYYPDEESYERLGAASRELLSTHKPFRDELQLVNSDGERLWVELNATVNDAESGEVLLLMMDVTQRRSAEAIRVRGLALELENRQLREASQFKDMFLSNMSHELRTPLNAIVGYTHLLQAGLVKPGSTDYGAHLDKIGSGARQLQELTGALLDFAKADAEALEFQPERVDPSRVVQVVLESLGDAIRAKDIDVVTTIDATLGDVTVDELRLTQVLSTYVSNAVKFSRVGGLVEIRVQADGPAEFRVEVEDHGNGIAAADLPRLFTVLPLSGAKADEDRATARSGSGIGLALSRKLVEAQGGRVGVVSRLAFGSSFHLVLPVAPSHAGPARAQPPK